MHVRVAFLFIIAVPIFAIAQDTQEKTKGKESAVQGTWKLISVEREGKAEELREKPPWWAIKKNKVLYAGKELAELAIDDATSPRCFDLTLADPKRSLEGIYAIDGDTLKICINKQADGVKERPTAFSTKGQSEWRLLVFRRDKDKKDPLEGLPGFVGLRIKTDPDSGGVLIDGTLKGSASEKADLKQNDLLVAVGGEAPKDSEDVVAMIRRVSPGTELSLRIKRDGKEQDVKLKIGVVPFFYLD